MECLLKIPIIPAFEPQISRRQQLRAEALARSVLREQPQLESGHDTYRRLVLDSPIGDEPSLQLDDFSEIPVIGASDNSQYMQQRARLRAVDGDYVAQSQIIEKGFSDYCQYTLGLGKVTWLYPATEPRLPRQIAFECWQDRRIRYELIQAVRRHGLRYIHPHISTLHVWELGALLCRATRRPIRIIGPTPALARWANNKIEFTRTAARLFGKRCVPHTENAYNFAMLSKTVANLAPLHRQLAIKYPYGTGGEGNFLIDAPRLRGLSLGEVSEYLKQLLSGHRWPKSGRILIDVWETDVLTSPSVQTWIPPKGHGIPLIEGLFEQSISGRQGNFIGSCPVDLPEPVTREIIDRSYLLAVVFQQLGYVGRCSFDLILVGRNLDNCQLKFIECNARWGGTSIPMMLINRLNLKQSGQTYSVRKVKVPGLDQIEFSQLHRALDTDLYDDQTGKGQFILFNPGRIKANSAIDAIAIGDSLQHANDLITSVLPARIAEFVRRKSASAQTFTLD